MSTLYSPLGICWASDRQGRGCDTKNKKIKTHIHTGAVLSFCSGMSLKIHMLKAGTQAVVLLAGSGAFRKWGLERACRSLGVCPYGKPVSSFVFFSPIR